MMCLLCTVGVTHEQYVGCYNDARPRAMDERPGYYGSIDRCITECKTKGYTYVGVEVSHKVYKLDYLMQNQSELMS